MSTITKLYTFSSGATILAEEHNTNFDTLYNWANGNITNSNIKSGAAIAMSKLDLTGDVTFSGDLEFSGEITFSGDVVLGTANQGDIWYDDGTKMTRLTPGTDGYFLKTQGASADPVWAEVTMPTAVTYLIVNDTKAANTESGTFTQDAWQTRTLNTVVYNTITGASLGSGVTANKITLPAGTYIIQAIAPAYLVDKHKCKLKNITDNTDTLIGSSEFCDDANEVQSSSTIIGSFVIAAEKVFELQHYCSLTFAASGFGLRSNMGVSEIYAQVMISKVA